MAKKREYTIGHTVVDNLHQEIKRGDYVLFLTRPDLCNPFYYNNHIFRVAEVRHIQTGEKYGGRPVIEVVVFLWNGRQLSRTRCDDRLLKVNKLLPRDSYCRMKMPPSPTK